MGQNSVFIVPSENSDGSADEAWLDIGSPEYMDDLDNHEAHWITVPLTVEMDFTHTDEDIMSYVLDQVRARQAEVHQTAQHHEGVICISIPVPVDCDTVDMWIRAEVDAYRWFQAICSGLVTLNRDVIFREPPEDSVYI